MDKNKLSKAIADAIAQGKDKCKFVQSVEVAVNFRDVDFNKPENRLNLDVALPFAPRDVKVALFADGQLALDGRGVADKVISGTEVEAYSKDKKLQKELFNYSLLASTQLMPVIGKTLGQVLGTKGKLPKPVLPNANLKDLVGRTRRSVSIKTKGKYLPTVHAIVGKENMPLEQILENIQMVMESIGKTIPEHQIKSIFIKTTMGKPVKVTL